MNTQMNAAAATHTPGPWTSDPQETREQGEYIIGRGGEHLATVHDICHADQEVANARLIAAAPDLLQSGQYIDMAAPTCGLEGMSDDALISITVTVKGIRDLRSAIAKATA